MDKICSECTEPTLAHSLCTLCNKSLCYQCTDVHQHQRSPSASQYADSYQQQRPGATQCLDLHPRGSSSLSPTGQGPGLYPCSLLMCHSHRQEPLELFCESCDLLCCSSCHLSSHKNHRVVPIGKALQDQQWLFESLMVQVEEKRSTVESNAKQIEDRLHGVKIAHRKAENQIKMAKMIMMNELNKRANLLIEQLEKISEDFQQRLENQLQGVIDLCSQLDHVQKFITWATTRHCRGPVLFSRALMSLQMQQLLEASVLADSWSPVKIKFDWDASYWTKQISSLGQLTVEGENCNFPSGLACSSIMRPQPITCLSLPTMFHRGREPGCGYQACCEPQMCCLHGIPSQSDLTGLDKSQMETSLYNSSCTQTGLTSASLHQNQQLQRCWNTESTLKCPRPTSPVPIAGQVQLSCNHGSAGHSQAADSLHSSQSAALLSSQEHQRQIQADNQSQLNADCCHLGQCKAKLSISTAPHQDLSHAAINRDVGTEESWGARCRMEQVCCETEENECRELLNEEVQTDTREESPVQQLLQPQLPTPLAAEQQKSRFPQTTRNHKDGKRSTSLEVSPYECASDAQSSRLSASSPCSRRQRRSRSIPTELVAPPTSPYSVCNNSREPEAPLKFDVMDPRQRRASDGLLRVVKEIMSDETSSTGCSSPSLSYKMEPDQTCMIGRKAEYGAKEKSKATGKSFNNTKDVLKDSGRSRVPVVCLERLKILVSQLPPHGRRQSDPLPASSADNKNRHDVTPEVPKEAGDSETRRMTRSLTGRQYATQQTRSESIILSTNCGFDKGRLRSHQTSVESPVDLAYFPQCYSAGELDSDSDPRSASEEANPSSFNPDEQLDSDELADSDANATSSSEAELESVTEEKLAATGDVGCCGDSEPSLESEVDPESDGGGSEDGQELDVYTESGDAQTESDTQFEYDPTFQTETESDAPSDHPLDSQGSAESELDVKSETEFTEDDPQPLRSDLEEEYHHTGPSQRPLLIANPTGQRDTEDALSEQEGAEMESEDFCAVCLIGGELLCCDHCPKVFHLSCHIPPLQNFPTGDWVCSLCRDVVQPEVEYSRDNDRTAGSHTANVLSAYDQKKCEKLTLLILSNILSTPFREPVSPLARHYYQIIKKPMDLSAIRTRLSRANPSHYSSPDQFVADVYLMFRNCAKFNYPDSEVAQAGHSLKAFFTSKLKEVFPDRVFPMAEADSDSDEYDEAYRTAENGFSWPERREQCHRKRKRRQSLKSRRHHF